MGGIMLDNNAPSTIFIEDMEIGMVRSRGKTITDRDIALFAEVSTDHNPVHLNEEYARDTMFAGRIAHGKGYDGGARHVGGQHCRRVAGVAPALTASLAPVTPEPDASGCLQTNTDIADQVQAVNGAGRAFFAL
jgi:3-hydroxybutyryl-CoA dehydratase